MKFYVFYEYYSEYNQFEGSWEKDWAVFDGSEDAQGFIDSHTDNSDYRNFVGPLLES
jgi:hypothetical protein